MRTIRVILDNPTAYYLAGDKLKGQVIFGCSEDSAVASVSISLIGRSKTKLIRRRGENRRVYRGETIFLQQDLVLFRGNYTLKANQYTWPFEFHLPQQTITTATEDIYDSTENGAYRERGEVYALPPSFDRYNSGWNQGKIEYKLEASIEKPDGGLFHTPVRHEFFLGIKNRRPWPEPAQIVCFAERMMVVQSLKLFPDKTDLTFKEKMHNLFKSGDVPSAQIVLRTSFPTNAYPGQSLPVNLSIAAIQCSSALEMVLIPVYLTSISVDIKAYHRFRAPTYWDSNDGEETCRYPLANLLNLYNITIPQALVPEKRGLVSSFIEASSSSTPPTMSNALNLSTLTNQLDIPDLTPSTKTQNISISYRLKIKMKLECAEKRTTFELSEPLEIYSQVPSLEAVVTNGNGNANSVIPQAPLPVYTADALPGTVLERGEDAEPEGSVLPVYEAPPEYEGKDVGMVDKKVGKQEP